MNVPIISLVDLEHHRLMLKDKVRLNQYRLALQEILAPGTEAVEIGFGTGILLAYASQFTNASLTGIEYSRTLHDVAQHCFRHS